METVGVGQGANQRGGQLLVHAAAGQLAQRTQGVLAAGIRQGVKYQPLKAEMQGAAAGRIDAAHGGDHG